MTWSVRLRAGASLRISFDYLAVRRTRHLPKGSQALARAQPTSKMILPSLSSARG